MQLPESVFEHFCGHDDLFTLDVNEPDEGEFSNFIGFFPVTPDWCPLKFWKEIDNWFKERQKEPVVHYMILRWLPETLKYEVVFYTHEIEEFDKYALKYPESDGYMHMIPLSWIKSHDIMIRVKAIREREKANNA